MIVQLTPAYKFVCDRCGKEEFPDENGFILNHKNVVFEKFTDIKTESKKGTVCEECLAEFWEFAENFFDEVNKERREG